MRMLYLTAALTAVVLAGCSDSPDAEPAPTIQATTTPAAQASTITPMVVQPQVTHGGKTYEMPYYQCAQRIWDARVGEWNTLTQKRDAAGASDVVVAGRTFEASEEYFQVKRWPATFEATLEAAATRKACPK